MELQKYNFQDDAAELYEMQKKSFSRDFPSDDVYTTLMRNREGFTFLEDGRKVGYALYDKVSDGNFMFHIFVDPICRGKGKTGERLATIFDYGFKALGAERITTMIVTDLTDDQYEGFVSHAGFIKEGVIRSGHKHNGRFHDVKIYGLLKEERRY